MEGKFLAGMRRSRAPTAAVAKDLWSLMTAAADYSFNKSHAACYALISYRTAYLKANYPAEYMAAVISSVMSTKDKVPFFVNRCEEMGIEVLPPDVNSSDHGFVVSGKSIRFGLDAVKNVGHAAVEAIIAARERGGPFDSIWDFCERVDARAVNKRAVECLIKCGALDSTGRPPQGDARGAVRGAGERGQKSQEDARRGQGSIFDLGGGRRPAGRPRRAAAAPPALDPARGVRPARAAAAREGDARDVPLGASAGRGARRAAGAGGLLAAGRGREGGRRLGDGRRDRQRVQAGADSKRRLRDVRDPRRPGGAGRAVRPRRRGRGGRVRSSSIGWSWCAAGSTTRGAARLSLVVAEAEAFEPGEDEVAAARAKAKARRPDRICCGSTPPSSGRSWSRS